MNLKKKLRSTKSDFDTQPSLRREPIAIIGIGCRYPGISNPAEFWQTVIEGKEVVGHYPGGRFAELDHLYEEARRKPGRLLTDRGGFLEDVAGFDSEFFEYSPREAVYLDPQHRLLLEVALEALDDAGQTRENYAGSATGVYTGLWTSEYEARLYESSTERDLYSVTGCAGSAAPARVSFAFGLEGPSLTVDTACSSSLAAVHLACQALWAGEIDMALAGGSNLILGTEISELFTQANILSPDGRCKFGDASANGFVRCEGAGIVVLKRLSQAVADKDPIYAVIRGSAMNNDGRTTGLMTPSIEAQEGMMLAAWKAAEIDPKDILYIETHGTGTGIGDRVELRAATRALEQNGVTKPCWLGSVKTNMGHAEAAAGVAGLIKGALTAKHRRIAPSLHFKVPNPKIAWDKVPVRIATEAVDLSAEPGPILVGVSSFGLSGTNVHVVLEEAAVEPVKTSQGVGPYMLPISAKTPEALHAMLGAHLAAMQAAVQAGEQEYPVRDVCYTASARRNHYEYRAAIVGEDRKELEKNLTAAIASDGCDGVICDGVAWGRKNPDKEKIVFVAPGQGSQWLGMAKELFDHDSVFRQAFEQCDAAIAAETGWRLVDRVLGPDAERYYSQIDVIQPALFAMSVALAAVWQAWGIEPDAVVGHSMGEVAAAHIAGILSLKDAAAIICGRSHLMRTLRSAGSMATVELSLHEVEALLQSRKDVSVAASNGPHTTVISGDSKAVEALLKELEAKEIYCRQIKVDVASHSAQVDPILDDLLGKISGVRPQPAKIPMLSTVTGEYATDSANAGVVMEAAYWVENLRRSVLFAPAIEKLSSEGYGTFIELSPHPILLPSIAASAREVNRRALAVASLRREKPARTTMLCGLAELYVAGRKIAWERLYPEEVRCVRLPQYQFQRKRYWPASGDDDASQEIWRRSTTAALAQSNLVPIGLDVASLAAKQEYLDRWAVAEMLQTLRTFGAFAKPETFYDAKSLAAAYGILPAHVKLMDRWLNLLCEAGYLDRDGSGYRNRAPLPDVDTGSAWREVEMELGGDPFLLDYLRNCSKHLRGVLLGTTSPLETLFPGGSPEVARNLYGNSVGPRYANLIVAAAVQAACAVARENRKLRILELGAGTGATTSAILPTLPTGRVSYTFTDVSEVFLQGASRRFAQYPFVKYGLLDIEDEQQLAQYAGSFDIVIAANVVHATRDLGSTLSGIESLLTPGGALVLLETTKNMAWHDITTGLIEGWQKSEDEIRGTKALLGVDDWNAVLRHAGFEDVFSVPEAGSPVGDIGLHVILARGAVGKKHADQEPRAFTNAAPQNAWVPLADANMLSADGSLNKNGTATAIDTLLRDAPASEHRAILLDVVCEEIARVLRLPADRAPKKQERLMNLGLDSLMAVELRNRIASRLGLESLPATLIFDYATPDAIAGYLLDRVQKKTREHGETSSLQPPVQVQEKMLTAEEVANLPEEDIAALLRNRLSR